MSYREKESYRNNRGKSGSGYGGNARGGSGNGRREPVPRKKGSKEDLRRLLLSLDHRSYPAYKQLAGSWRFENYALSIDHVQGDPFAAPSSVSIHVDGKTAGFPQRYWKSYENRRALQDHLIRRFHRLAGQYTHRARGSGKSGSISCSDPGQEILDRSACQFSTADGSLIFRLSIGFPAAGRTILAGELEKILFDYLPACAQKSLFCRSYGKQELEDIADLAEDQTQLRRLLKENGLIAFVADGAILPRESGISQKPMRDAIPFRSPQEDAVTLELPHAGKITGMGIRRGITLIIGGGYHGKSTLLQALERGVYDHIRGDGREFVITDDTAVKIRAEEGRYIMKNDISAFIRNLPNGLNTSAFSTENASGSTSQAAGLVEAVESGAQVLIMDEDTCATNFMVRDELMQRIVSPEEEPIIPYSRTMRPLFEQEGISTILAAGSSGAFFSVADRIIQMDQYRPKDVTERVRQVLVETDSSGLSENGRKVRASEKRETAEKAKIAGADHCLAVSTEKTTGTGAPEFIISERFPDRCPTAGKSLSPKNGRLKHKNLGRDGFTIDHETVDLRCVEQIVDREQTECLALLLIQAAEEMDGKRSLREIVARIRRRIEKEGMQAVSGGRVPGNLALPRQQELFAALNRCRLLQILS